jgi:hypothetical protein
MSTWSAAAARSAVETPERLRKVSQEGGNDGFRSILLNEMPCFRYDSQA